jgi:hypothetical protein
MPPVVGQLVLVVSGLGFPLTQVVIRRLGRPGAVAVVGVAAGLLVRDLALIAMGTPRRLQSGPAAMLYAETAAAAASVVLCLPVVTDPAAHAQALATRPGGREGLRRFALGALFGLHTARFRIYLSPDQGRRPVEVEARAA